MLLEAGPPPVPLADLQYIVLWAMAALLAARLIVAPTIYIHARGKTNAAAWWGTAAVVSPLISGVLYLVFRRPKDRPGPSSWNPWVPCPQCGTPRGWSPDPCPRCGHVLPGPAAPSAPLPGYPQVPPGYATPRPGYAPAEPPKPASKDITVAQIGGSLLFALGLTNIAAALALMPMMLEGATATDLIALQDGPVFVLLALILQDSVLLAVTLDQSIWQGRLTRAKMGIGWKATGHPLHWHIGMGLAAGALTFVFSALVLDFMSRVLESVGVSVSAGATGAPTSIATGDYLMLIPSYVFIAPVAEEFFFRGYALGGLAQRGHVNFGVLFTSALFGLIHLNPLSFVPITLAGVVLAVTCLRTGSLVAPIVAHATNNFTALTLAYLGV